METYSYHLAKKNADFMRDKILKHFIDLPENIQSFIITIVNNANKSEHNDYQDVVGMLSFFGILPFHEQHIIRVIAKYCSDCGCGYLEMLKNEKSDLEKSPNIKEVA